MSYIQRPKSDLGTIFVHWLIVASLLSAALTGLSIASVDDPSLWASRYLDSFLPRENIWFVHLAFGIALISSLAAYVVYIRQAKLGDRIRFNGSRLRALFLEGRPRWASVNVLLYWTLFTALALEIVTGTLLFFGVGGFVLTLHLHTTWFFLTFAFLHMVVHWLYGGQGQLLRIFRPQWRLPQQVPQFLDALIERVQQLEIEKASPVPAESSPGTGERRQKQARTMTIVVPLAIAVAAGAAMVPLSTFLEKQSRDTLKIVSINEANAPDIDGDLSDGAWRRAPVTTVLTQHGANFDGGESKIEIRALHDETFAYFAFTWTDPTRSLMHMPLVKEEDGWHLMRSSAEGNEVQFHEDKFAVLLAPPGQPLIGKGIHLGRQPLSDKPASATGRGLHFVVGGAVDVWQWRASHCGKISWLDHGHFGPPLPASATQPERRYKGGFALDPGSAPYEENFDFVADQGAYPLVRPKRLPKDPARIVRVASLNFDPEISDPESQSFYISDEDSEPYSVNLDGALPVGAVIPGIILATQRTNPPADVANVIGTAHWASGRWSLEVRRRLDTGNATDVSIKTGALMWVAAFDHAETWHSYHIRPLKLEVE
jgi:hypothetical protein